MALWTVVFALFWPIWPPYRPCWSGDRSRRSRSTAEYYFRSGQTGSSIILTSRAYITHNFIKNLSPEALAAIWWLVFRTGSSFAKPEIVTKMQQVAYFIWLPYRFATGPRGQNRPRNTTSGYLNLYEYDFGALHTTPIHAECCGVKKISYNFNFVVKILSMISWM